MAHGNRLGRACAAPALLAASRPRTALALGGALVLAAVALAALKLEYRTQRNDLLAADAPCQQRWQKYLDAFGDDDDAVVVVRGDAARARVAADRVAALLENRPDLFDRVFHRLDLRPLHGRCLYHLPAAELAAIDRRLAGMEPLLGPLAPISWRALGMQALLARAAATAEKKAAGQTLAASEEDLLSQTPALLEAATAYLTDPADARNPWSLSSARGDDRQLREPQYLTTPDGALTLVLARPKKAAGSFAPAKEAADAAREILKVAAAEFPNLSFGLTGLPVLESDEMQAGDDDSARASGLALAGVAILYLIAYRGVRYPLLTVGTLLAGTAWAVGWATLTVGHLNILTAAFAVMIIGMGDYGVLFVARYDAERRLGAAHRDAISRTAAHAGPGIVTAAATAALAFFATLFADFAAVAELGWIAGWGVLFCALAALTLLPAALTLTGGGGAAERPGRAAVLAFPRPFLPALAYRPKTVLVLGLIAVFIILPGAARLRYDANLLHLQADGLDSVAWEHELIAHAAGQTWDVVGVAATAEAAARLRATYERIPGVGRVVDAAALVPTEQASKTPLVAAIHAKLASLPADPPAPIPPGDVAGPAARLGAADPALAAGTARFRAAAAAAPDRLAAFDRHLGRVLHADLTKLKAVSHPVPIQLTDLPAAFRARYIGANGEYAVRGYCDRDLWEYDRLAEFTAAAAAADPAATGKAFRTVEGLRTMKAGFFKAAGLSLLVIVLVLAADLRSGRGVLLGLFPLAVGAAITAGLMGWVGVPLNPANLIALPLIVGVGVDNGVHVLHDYAEHRGPPYALGAATGRGIVVAALTTVLGFGALGVARHRGMASLGLVLAAGVSACLVAAVVLLPAVLRLQGRSGRRAAETAPDPRRRAA